MSHYDVIVIGGGLGGLVSGAKLAKEGKKVLLVEQNHVLGGCATTFRRRDFLMEVGLQQLDGLDINDPKMEIFEDLGVFDNITFVQPKEFYRFVRGEEEFVLPTNTGDAQRMLIQHFPKEKKGIRKFFRTIAAIRKQIFQLPIERKKLILAFPLLPFTSPQLVRYMFTSLGSFMDSIFKDERLKLLLQANLLYFNDDPYTMSLLFFSAGQASYFGGGVHYIKGGSQTLSDYLGKVIMDHGGEIKLRHIATEILTEDNQATGVEYQQSFGEQAEKQIAYAKCIIANAAIPNVATMLPEHNATKLKKSINSLKPSSTLLSVLIGFKREIRELKNLHYATAVFDDEVVSQKDILPNNQGTFEKKNFVFTDYSQVDSALTPKGKSFGSIITVDYIGNWKKLDKKAYRVKKEEVAQIFFDRLEKLIPGIKSEIEYYVVSTSRSISRWTLNPKGSIYGFAQTPLQAGLFRVPNRSPVDNLYFSSAWSYPGGGFSGAIVGGWYTAKLILKRN